MSKGAESSGVLQDWRSVADIPVYSRTEGVHHHKVDIVLCHNSFHVINFPGQRLSAVAVEQ